MIEYKTAAKLVPTITLLVTEKEKDLILFIRNMGFGTIHELQVHAWEPQYAKEAIKQTRFGKGK